MLLPLL